MHDIHKESKDAFIRVIPILIDRGYQLVTVSDLMSLNGINMKNGEIYYSGKTD